MMENRQISQNNTSFLHVVNNTPKWLLIIFKIYGGLFAISGVLLLGYFLGIIISSILLFSNIISNIIPASVFLIALIIIGIGCWYMKRWVIPLLLVFFINGLVGILVYNLKINIYQLGVLIGVVIIILAYNYRQYFFGSYKNYIIQTTVVLALIIVNIGTFYPAAFSKISEADIDAYIQSQEFQNFITNNDFQNTIKTELLKQHIGDKEKTQQFLNILKNEPKQNHETIINILKKSPEFRGLIRMILETNKNF